MGRNWNGYKSKMWINPHPAPLLLPQPTERRHHRPHHYRCARGRSLDFELSGDAHQRPADHPVFLPLYGDFKPKTDPFRVDCLALGWAAHWQGRQDAEEGVERRSDQAGRHHLHRGRDHFWLANHQGFQCHSIFQ